MQVTENINQVLKTHTLSAVVHFAGLKAVGESIEKPYAYYETNVQGTLMLLKAMAAHGDPAAVPIAETAPLRATNPYGRSKLMVEDILRDRAHAIPNNLMPYVAQVAVGQREKLNVFGNDYPTPDGTGVRDYIHVVDFAKGHVAALNRLLGNAECVEVNLGTGQGYSVLQMIKAFEAASGKPVPFEVVARRPGDIASCYASTTKAREYLGWQAELGLNDMCASAWKWESMNPKGYNSKCDTGSLP